MTSLVSPASGDVPINVSEPPLALGHDHTIRHSVPDPPTESWRSKFTPGPSLVSVTSTRVIISPGPRGGSPANALWYALATPFTGEMTGECAYEVQAASGDLRGVREVARRAGRDA
jgi:hypothetical protein